MQTDQLSRRVIAQNLFIYGSMHALVDAVCVASLFSISRQGLAGDERFFSLVIFYGALAFGLQAPLGLLVDRFRMPRQAALLGALLSAGGLLAFASNPLLAVTLTGIGNALFHIGGGTIAFNLTPHRAAAPGVFVAPGALGLFYGTLAGKSGDFSVSLLLAVLLVFCVFAMSAELPLIDYDRRRGERLGYFRIIFLFLFASVFIRSLVGFILVFPWKTDPHLAVLLAFFIVLGKASGGIIADRLGWVRVAVGASLLSLPLLAFGSEVYFLALAGILLFNMTMPVTLIAFAEMIPGRPAFAFGLTCLALILGAVPAYAGYGPLLSDPFFIFAVILASASFLNTGLQLLQEGRRPFLNNR